MKILIIGDNLASIELLKSSLSTPDINTLAANSTKQALHLIESKIPDLVLLDVPPYPNYAIQSCKELRQATTIPFIVLSTINDPEMVAKILDAGADDFLVKPFSFDILSARINKLIRRIQVYSPSPIS